MTTPPPAKPPREFWIVGPDDDEPSVHHINPGFNDQVHVIERSAYDQLQRELAFVKTQWKQTSDLLEQERNRLTAELADVRKERDELLAKGKGNVFVHRHHYDQALSQAAALAGALDEADKQLSNEGDCLTCDFDGYINKTHHADCITQFIKTVIAESRAWLEKERGR